MKKKLRLKELRENQFLSQRELGARAGIGYATICRLEGGRNEPTWQTIRKLAAALGVEPGELMERE